MYVRVWEVQVVVVKVLGENFILVKFFESLIAEMLVHWGKLEPGWINIESSLG